MKPIIAYHFVGEKLRDGRPVPPDGETLVHKGPLVLCRSGLHASVHPFDALQYAPGATLCLVECSGEIVHGDDKLVCSRRKIVKRIDATDLLRKFARQQALSVIHLWDAPDVVRRYLKTGDESLRAATQAATRGATRDATRAAAWAAALAARRGAAWDATLAATQAATRAAALAAAQAAARKQFNALVKEALG